MNPRWRARPRMVLPALLAGLAIVAGGRLYLRYYEPVVQTVEVGMRGEAAANQFLAVERLLPRLGFSVRRCDGELGLPPPDHVLLLLNRSEPVARLRQAELLGWMRQGGRLIVTPTMDWEDPRSTVRLLRNAGLGDSPDQLLAAFGVKVKVLDEKVPALRNRKVRLPLAPVQDHGVVRVLDDVRLIDTRAAAAYARGDELGPTLLVFHHGKGELTVLNSGSFLFNHLLGKDDDAAFLLWLVLGRRGSVDRPAPKGVELSAYDEMPALVTLLAQHAWTFLVPALLLVAALAWRAAARFGPLLPDPPDERRALLEHLEAAGRWLWHGDHGRQRRILLDGVRRGLRVRLEARRPAWSKLAEPELIQRLGAAAGMAPQLVAEALHGSGIEDEVRFLTTIRTLALLRRSL
jgi:hypothetical protein